MTTFKSRPFNRDGSPAQTAALERQLRGLRAMESTEVYREMCAEEGRPKWANGQVAEKTPAQNTGRTHGLISTHNGGCRCDECRTASADYRRQQRAKAAS